MLAEAAFHSKTVTMPLNTARIQMNLMKEAIKSRDDHRRQLELLHDFAEASYGRQNLIRRLCREHNLIQVPEEGKPLKDLDIGWDFHVHDTASTGRKNPTQLIVDAFIKGMSRVTIAHSTAAVVDMMDEALRAGRALGVRVDIGLEFGANVDSRRHHFMALLPDIQQGGRASGFLKEHRHTLGAFLKKLEEDQKNGLSLVRKLVDNFNHTYLAELNDGYHDKLYQVPKLKMSALESFMPLGNLNRMHLGEFLHGLYRPVLVRRELFVRARREMARHQLELGEISEWDFNVVDRKSAELRSELALLSPDLLQKRYFTNPALTDHPTVFEGIAPVSKLLHESDCRLKVIDPLEHGLDAAKRLIDANANFIDQVEIYNMQDSVNRDPEEILRFASYVNETNIKRSSRKERIIVPVCGSDAAGRSPNIPGMGFIFSGHIQGKDRRPYVKRHVVLPALISRMIAAGRNSQPADEAGDFDPVVSMGKVVERVAPHLRDVGGKERSALGIRRVLRYLNPTLKNLCLVAAGFAFAYWYIGLEYALVWFAITSIRHFATDAIALRGLRLREWTTRSVDFGNMSRSLLFTGVSVPVLGYVKQGFDAIWPLAHAGILFNFARFFAISAANGVYLVLHNKLRGFEPAVVRANFFRSVISWPFASLFAPLGDLAGIPTIVQAKFWSDFVGGVIEGIGKFVRQLRLRRRDVEQIIPRVLDSRRGVRNNAIIDLLFLFRDDPRTRNSLHGIFKSGNTDEEAPHSDALLELSQIIGDPDLYPDLIRFIIGMRNEEMSDQLVTLAAETLPELSQWIEGEVQAKQKRRSADGRVETGENTSRKSE